MGVIYTGLFLSEPVRNLLLTKFPPKHPNVYADHVTLFYKPDFEAINDIMYRRGSMVSLYAVAHVYDEKGQALIVSVANPKQTDGIKITQDILHLTISCADGVQPVYSNELIKKAEITEPAYQFTAFTGLCAHEDKGVLPVEMHKRRGLSR